MGKRYDILCLPPQEKTVYFIVEAFSPDDPETAGYHYEEGSCPSDHFHSLDTIIFDGDTDPHGLFEYVRTTGELEFPEQAHSPGVEWPKVVPEAFDPALDLKANAAQIKDALKPFALEANDWAVSEPDWRPTVEFRRYDHTDKLTDCRLQQRWTRTSRETHQQEFEWRDVPIVWEKSVEGAEGPEAMAQTTEETISLRRVQTMDVSVI